MMAAVPAALLPIPVSLGLLTMLIAGLSILDAIPVFVAALVGFLVVQGLGLIKPPQPKKDGSEAE
jgi:hypothetical protein